MRKNLWRTLIFLCPLVCVALFVLDRHAQSADAPTQTPTQTDPAFEKSVQPFFAKNCYACHNDEEQTANLSLESFQDGGFTQQRSRNDEADSRQASTRDDAASGNASPKAGRRIGGYSVALSPTGQNRKRAHLLMVQSRRR